MSDGKESTAGCTPNCSGTYGYLTSPPPSATGGEGLHSQPHIPSVEEVLLWKQYRRRQKEGSRRSLDSKMMMPTQQLASSGPPSVRSTMSLTAIDSLSLSLSDSESHDAHRTLMGRIDDVLYNASSPGASLSPPTMIDDNGFPFISPASTYTEGGEIKLGLNTAPSQTGTVGSKESSNTPIGDSIDIDVQNSDPEDLDQHSAAHGGDHSVESLRSARSASPPNSEVPTEIASNTARSVAHKSTIIARRMMASGKGGELTVHCPSTPNNKSVCKLMPPLMTPNSTSGDETPALHTPGWEDTRPSVGNDILEDVLATPNAKDNLNPGQVSDSSESGEGDYAPEELLEEDPPLTPIEEMPDMSSSVDSPDIQDLSSATDQHFEDLAVTLPAWNSLHHTSENIMEDDRVTMFGDDVNPNVDDLDVEFAPKMSTEVKAENSPSSHNSGGSEVESSQVVVEKALSKDSVSPKSIDSNDVPTIDEVNHFMEQMKQIREDSRKTRRHNRENNDSDDVALKEEYVDYKRSLLERKEQLEMHKMESERRKREFDERLRALKSNPFETSPGLESRSMLAQANLTPPPGKDGAHAEPQQSKLSIGVDEDDFSFKPPSIAGGSSGIVFSPMVSAPKKSATAEVEKTELTAGKETKAVVGALLSTLGNAATSKIVDSFSTPRSIKTDGPPQLPAEDLSQKMTDASERQNYEAPDDRDALPQHPQIDDKRQSSSCTEPMEAHSSSISNASPEVSEGDKSAGIGSGYITSASASGNSPHEVDSYELRFTSFLNDRSDLISRTSSNLVELGVRNSVSIDPPTDDEKEDNSASTAEELLVGLTVQGSKKRKKKRRKQSIRTEDNESNSDDCSDGHQSSFSRKPQDPEGVVWKDVVKHKDIIDAPGSSQSKDKPNVRLTGANDQKHATKNKTPILHSEARCVVQIQKTEQSLKKSSLAWSLDIIKEDEADIAAEKKCESDGFDNVMSRAKMCLTSVEVATPSVQTLITKDGFPSNEVGSRPNETEPDSIATCRGAETREADDEGDSSIKKLRSKFESDSSGSGPRLGYSKVSTSASLSARRKAKSLVRAKKQDAVLSTQNMSPPSPESPVWGVAIDVKDPKSSDVVSFSKLRSRFEPQKTILVADRSKPRDKAYAPKSYQVEQTTPTQPIGRIYLKNSLQAMSSLGSETFETASSQKSSEDTIDDGTLGDGTINTKKVLRYAEKLERREREKSDIENDSSKSFDQSIDKRDTLSSKENHCGSEGVEKKGDEASIISMRKKAFESSSGRQSKPLKSIAASKNTLAANKPPQEIPSKSPLQTPTRNSSPISTDSPVITSVKDRIAVFGGRKQPPPQNPATPLRNALPRQPQNHQTPPPRTISTNGNNKKPSPLWTTNRTTGKPFSPMDIGVQQNRAGHRDLSRDNPRPTHASPSPPTRGDNKLRRPRNLGAIDTGNESPNAKRNEFAEDDDDGITLSPTLSEVSGLTLPTCLGTVASGTLGSNRGSDLFDDLPSIAPISPASALNRGPNFHEAMSPIARHRQQQKSAAVMSFSSNTLADRPHFNKEVSSSPQTPSAMSNRLHELKTPRARGSPAGPKAGIQSDSSKSKPENKGTMTRREQIISKVRASPRNSYLAQPSPRKRVLTKSQEWPERNSIREGPSVSKSSSSEKTNIVQSNSNEGKTVQHFDGRASEETAKTRGRVAERVARANKMANRRHGMKPQPHNGSLATRDCIRVD